MPAKVKAKKIPATYAELVAFGRVLMAHIGPPPANFEDILYESVKAHEKKIKEEQ